MKENILIVDDSPEILGVLSAILEGAGHRWGRVPASRGSGGYLDSARLNIPRRGHGRLPGDVPNRFGSDRVMEALQP